MFPETPRTNLLSYPLEPWKTLSARGEPVTLWKRSRMPRIDDRFLECVVYFYPSTEAAQEGRRAGGCGFWVSVPGQLAGFHHAYIVTNGHVVRDIGSCRVIRINRIGGGFDVVETTKDGWFHHENGDDVAIYKLDPTDTYKFKHVSTDMFVTHDLVRELNIGPGDDVVTAGRFITHDGKESNNPILRFGNIAMMPLEPIALPSGLRQESFLVESRSLIGASGSPVFVRISLDLMGRPGVANQDKGGVFLLGINWGHLNLGGVAPDLSNINYGAVYGKDNKPHPEGWKVPVNTGMMGVVPAWKILELLNQADVAEHRLSDEIRKSEENMANMIASLDSMPDETKRQLLEALNRKLPPKD